MTEPETTIEEPTGEGRADSPARPGAEPGNGGGPLIEADLLVEEVSIDGMCGVY